MEIKEFLKERGLTTEFNLAVMDEADAIPDTIPEEELARRRNLFDTTIVTIDGDDAKDLDDAVSIERMENGHYYLGVHIADVSYYVRENSALDDEAFNRGTSVYLVDTVVPMLPKKLSNGICSLNPQQPRLTMSCFMEIDEGGGIVDYELCESAIISNARMTYKKVTQILEGNMAARNEYANLIPMFELMREAALVLRDKRMRRGSIDFDFPEAYVITDETGKAIDITQYPITISNKIIEEFMLAANETVARHFQKLKLPCVYRVHENPESEKVQRLADLIKSFGYKFKMKEEISPKALQNILFKVDGTAQQSVISTLMLRSMMKARYCEENLGHFGLAAENYCHFTSPIRRYPDLMVHRILRLLLQGKLDEKTAKRYQRITRKAAEQSSDREVDAVMAERDFVDYKMCEYMQDKVGMEYTGLISSVTSFGFFVQLPNLVEGLVRMVDLEDDYYIFDETRLILTGKRSGREYHMGEQIRVRVAKVNLDLKQIDFVPVAKEKKKAKKEVKKQHGGKSKRKHRPRLKKKNGRAK